MMKKAFLFLFALVFVLTPVLIPGITLTARAAADFEVTTITELRNAISDPLATSIIALKNDIAIDVGAITIPTGKNITLTSDGGPFTIKSVAGSRNFIIQSGGQLILDNIILEGNDPSNGGGIKVESSGILTMNDGAVIQKCRILGNGGGVEISSGGTLTMNAGAVIQNCKAGNGTPYTGGGGVYNYGTFDMNNGKIWKNDASGGDCFGGGVNSIGTFNMRGGEICENSTYHSGGGVQVNNNGIFNMYGGKIYGNETTATPSTYVTPGGGGVNVENGTFNMYGTNDPVIEKNKSSFGGGVCTRWNSVFNMSGGKIIENETYGGKKGGGVYIGWFTGTSSTYSPKFYMSGGLISGNNNEIGYGGGVNVNNGIFEMTGGTVSYNKADYGGGIYLNDFASGSFIDGGAGRDNIIVTGNTADINGGGIMMRHVDPRGTNVKNCTVTNNKAQGGGGGIFAWNAISLTQTQIVNIENVLTENNLAAQGGGIMVGYAGGGPTTCTIKDCDIIWNTAIIQYNEANTPPPPDPQPAALRVQGGGLTCGARSTVTVINTKINNNKAIHDINNKFSLNGNGGGVFVEEYPGRPDIGAATLTMIGGEIKYNEVINGNGGGIYNGMPEPKNTGFKSNPAGEIQLTKLNISGADISYNKAFDGNGGGIFNFGKLTAENNTKIYNNTAILGGGIYNDGCMCKIYKDTIKEEKDGFINPYTNEYKYGTTDIKNSSIYNNTATGFIPAGERVGVHDRGSGGGIYTVDLTKVTTDNVAFSNNKAPFAYLWDLGNAKNTNTAQMITDAGTHGINIKTTTYTTLFPFTNAYNNYDINYITEHPLLVVTFDGNGGTVLSVDETRIVEYEDSLGTNMPPNPTRTGYTFKGWNTKADGTGTWFTSLTEITENITVYAQWEKIIPPEKPDPKITPPPAIITPTDEPETTTAATVITTTAAEEITTTEKITTTEEVTTEEPTSETTIEEITTEETITEPASEKITKITEEKIIAPEPATEPIIDTIDTIETPAAVEPTVIPTEPVVNITELITEAKMINPAVLTLNVEIFEKMPEGAVPLGNGWFAVDLGDDVWEIFDKTGVPIGVVILSNGENITDYDVEYNLIPMADIIIIPETKAPPAELPKENAKTGDSIQIIAGLLILMSTGIFIYRKKLLNRFNIRL